MHARGPRGGVLLHMAISRRLHNNLGVSLEFTVLKKVQKAAISTWIIRSGVLC